MASTYVIIGASLAGATAAITLREEGADGSVILIGAEREPPYERPPLSKAYLRGEAAFDKSLVRPLEYYKEHDIETILGTRAIRIDSTARMVELEDHRRVPFDALLIATGARNRRISIPGGELEGIYSLRTVQDADRIRAEMVAGRRVVVVGMGFIGSEVAASLQQKGLQVVAIEPAKTPLFRVLGEEVGQTIADLHRAHGVRIVMEDTVAAFEGSTRVASVITKAGLRLDCDFVVAGIGVEPAVEMLEGSGIHIDNGVVVDAYCETNVSGIYAAGDVANHHHPIFDRQIRVEHWQNAIKQGAAAARNMLGKHVPYRRNPLVLVGPVRSEPAIRRISHEVGTARRTWQPGFGQLSGVLCERRQNRRRCRSQPREGRPARHAAHQVTAQGGSRSAARRKC